MDVIYVLCNAAIGNVGYTFSRVREPTTWTNWDRPTMKSFKNMEFAGIEQTRSSDINVAQQASLGAERKSDRIVSSESLIRPQQNLNKEVERGIEKNPNYFGRSITKIDLKRSRKNVSTNVKFLIIEMGNPPICDRGRFIECMQVCKTYKRADFDWVCVELLDYFREERIYLRTVKCPTILLERPSFKGIIKSYNITAGVLFNKILDVFVKRILYDPAYHWQVVHSSINGYDSGMGDAFTNALLKLSESKEKGLTGELINFVVKNYRTLCRCMVPAHLCESLMWKKHKCFQLPVVAQGLFGDFSKMIVKHMLEWSTSGKFLLDISNDVLDVMRRVTEWIMNAVGIDLLSTSFFSKIIKTFCVTMVGALIIQIGQFSLQVVWSLLAAVMKIFLGATMGAVFTMMDIVNDCVAQGDSQVLYTLLNFGALAIIGSKMPLSGQISAARAGAPIVECLWEKIRDFINFCAKQFLGKDCLLGSNEVPALKKFVDELQDVLSVGDVGKRCLVDTNLMRKIQMMYHRSVEIRKILLKTDCYDGPARTQIAILIAKLDNLYASTLSTSSLVVNRPIPDDVYLCGPPGQGKTTILDILASGIHAFIMQRKLVDPQLFEVLKDDVRFSQPYENYFKYPRVLGSQYWEGYSGQWMVQYNEIFSNKSPLENAPIAMELLMAVESCSFPLDMAFGEKGKNFFVSDLIICTSNRDTFENIGLAVPEAFMRRLHYPITVMRNQTLLADRSNLNEAWKLKVNFFENVKGAADALALGLNPGLLALHNERVQSGDGSFGVVDLIRVIGTNMVSKYLNPTIAQRASTIEWDSIFADQKRVDRDYPKGKPNFSESLDKWLSNSVAQGGDEEIESFSSSSFEDEEIDEPELQHTMTWSDYLKSKLGYSNYTVFHTVPSGEVEVEDLYIGASYIEAATVSQNIGAAKKMELVDLLNKRTVLSKRLVKTYYESPKNWFEMVNICREHNMDITSNSVGFLNGINVFGKLEIGNVDCEKPSFTYDLLSDGFIYYSNYQLEYNNIVVSKTFDSWFTRVRKALCLESEASVFIAVLGLGLATTLAYFGMKKLTKYFNVVNDDDEFSSVDEIHAHSPKDKALAMNTRFKVVPRAVSEAQGSTVEVDLVNRCNNILGNLRWARLIGQKKVWTQILFGMPGVLVLPLHSWYHAAGVNTIEIQDSKGVTTTFFSEFQWEVSIPQNRDLVFLRFKDSVLPMEGVRNIIGSIPDSILEHVESPVRLMRVLDEKTDRYSNMFFGGKSIKYETTLRNNVLNEDVKVPMSGYYVMEGGKGSAGMCSSPVITRDTRYQNTPILGIHIGRYGDDSMIAPLFRSDFNFVRKTNEPQVISTAQGFLMDYFQEEVSDAVPKGTCAYKKPFKASFMMQKTELKPSILYPYLPPAEVAPAMLRKTGDVDPLSKAHAKYDEHNSRPMNKWSASLMGENFNYLKMFYRKDCEYKELTFDEAVFGDGETDNSVDGLELNTSSGFPFVIEQYCPKRKDWFTSESKTSDLKSRVDKLKIELEMGIYSPQIVVDQLKDELRDNERVMLGKTRLFCVGSIVDCILAKMTFGGYLAPMKKHLFYSSACIGTNPHDMSWAMLYQRIEKWPENKRSRWFGGDASGFDNSIQRWEIGIAYYYVRHTLPVPHSNVKFWNRVKGLFYRVATTVHVSRDQAYICEFRNSSGNWLTAWLNSIVMECRMLACFLKRKPAGLHYEKYDDMPITLMVYGDDNIGSVRDDIEWFDNLTLKSDMLELFGCPFTDPKKGEIKERFLDLESQIFLARSFDVQDYSIVKAPLSIDSIMGMLYYVRGNTRSEQIDRLKQNVMTAMQELSHYKQEDQDKYHDLIRTAYEKTGLVWDFDSPEKWTLVRAERSSDAFLFCH